MNPLRPACLPHRPRLFSACGAVAAALLTHSAVAAEAAPQKSSYLVIAKKSTMQDAAWQEVVTALQTKHEATVATYETSVDEVLPALRKEFPRYTCFVAPPDEANRAFVAQVHQLTRKLDDDIYTDTRWGILTGYDAANALAIAREKQPLTVRKVGAGTQFAMDMVEEGLWYDELVKNKMVRKKMGGAPETLKVEQDTTKALVDTLNDYQPDCFLTSGHATERDWQIGFAYRNGCFMSKEGQLTGYDIQRKSFDVKSDNPKVYLAIGNCLMGHVKDRNSMALAWMNSAGVRQMIGYTVKTWFGYAGWGCLDYFIEQPGRYTLTEAFLANHHALVFLLDKAPSTGLKYDRDVLAFYGDPKWEARMADRPKAWDQSLLEKDGTYTFEIKPKRGEASFVPSDMNGSQRGGRPLVAFFPARLKNVEVVSGADLNPVITDDFILIPNPLTCDPKREYKVVFKALAM
jgi:zinc protease